MRNQKKLGIVISYMNMMMNTFIGVFFTPFLIKSLGVSEFGLYQLINSFAGYLVIMNFGISAVMTRNVAGYLAKDDKEGQENFIAMGFGITAILVAIMLVVGGGLFFGIEGLFKNSLSGSEIVLAKQLYIILILNIAVTICVNAFTGLICAHEKFAVSNGLLFIKYLLRIATLVILLLMGYKSFAIVLTDLCLSILWLAAEIFYCFKVLKIKVKYHYLDKQMLKLSLTFSLAMVLQSVVSQVNMNIPRIVLGAMTDTSVVALYSIVLTLYITFGSITGAIGNVFVPQATRMVMNGATSEQLTDLVIRPGRYQFMISGAILIGFIILGQDFIKLWVGENFLDAYIPTLILIIPVIIPLIQSVVISVLDAMMKRMIRSVVLVAVAVINITLSIVLVHYFGYIGAAIGTSVSIILGNIIFMNYYYYKYIHLNVFRMFKEIFKGILLCLLISGIATWLLDLFLGDSIVLFLSKVMIFIIIYAVLLYKIGFNAYEKDMFIRLLSRLKLTKKGV